MPLESHNNNNNQICDIEDFAKILSHEYDDELLSGSTKRLGNHRHSSNDKHDSSSAVVRIRRLNSRAKRERLNEREAVVNGRTDDGGEEISVTSCCCADGSCHDHQRSRCCSSSSSKTSQTNDDGIVSIAIDQQEASIVLTNDLNPAAHLVYVKTWGCSHNNSDSEYMAGLLAQAGYGVTTTNYPQSSVIILNSCTVKGPSEQHFKNEITKATTSNKHLILAGCVPQSDKSYRKLASVVGVTQIHKIVDVVEETLRGNKVCYFSRKRKKSDGGEWMGSPDLALPKIRKNELIEIVPVSSGCLNNCTYCKTKLARGQLASYSVASITTRIHHVITHENIKEIWLTSEDLGAWGIDLGLTIVDLLNAIVQVLAEHEKKSGGERVMLRLGMTNPPYIMEHLEEISKILSHPNVYEFLHIPVQSGSDSVLLEMKREYGRKDFERICDFMLERHPSITIATDIICGYPTETPTDFEETFSLIQKYKPPVLFINQFYPRPGTPASQLKRIPTEIVKSRTRRLNDLFQSYTSTRAQLDPHHLTGSTQTVLVTELAHDGVKYVGHNKHYQQVLVDKHKDNVMGRWVNVSIDRVGKFSMIGGAAQVTTRRNYSPVVLLLFILLLCYYYIK